MKGRFAPPTGKDIAITGQVAAGKTEFAKRLSHASGIPTLSIDDVGGDWPRFRQLAHQHDGPLILESIAAPAWPLALHIHCRCDEATRQRRLHDRPAHHHGPPTRRYDYVRTADLTVDTTATPDLMPILSRIGGRGA